MASKWNLCGLRAGIILCGNIVLITWLLLMALAIASFRFGSPATSVPLREIPSNSVFAGLSADNLSDAASYIWIQPSDVHIRENDSASTKAFREFCNSVVPYIKPE